jgi:hypothetical protein
MKPDWLIFVAICLMIAMVTSDLLIRGVAIVGTVWSLTFEVLEYQSGKNDIRVRGDVNG